MASPCDSRRSKAAFACGDDSHALLFRGHTQASVSRSVRRRSSHVLQRTGGSGESDHRSVEHRKTLAVQRLRTDLDLTGLSISSQDIKELLKVDDAVWEAETADIREHLKKFGNRLPARLNKQFAQLRERLD